MNYVEKFFDGVQSAIKINPATFSGAVDIVVVEQEDGSYRSTPWHVRFGKLQLLSSAEAKTPMQFLRRSDHFFQVRILINDKPVKGLKMKLGDVGESYFVHTSTEPVAQEIQTSPVSTSPDVSDTEVDLRAAEADPSNGHSDNQTPGPVRFGRSDVSSDPGRAQAGSGTSSPGSFTTPIGSPLVESENTSAGAGSAATPVTTEEKTSGWGWGWGGGSKSMRKSSSAEDIPKPLLAPPQIPHPSSESPAIPIGSVSAAHSSKLSSKRSNSFDASGLGPLDEKHTGTVKPGSWSSQVGSWFGFLKKDKKKDDLTKSLAQPDIESGQAHSPYPKMPAEPPLLTAPANDVDEYDRNLAYSPVSTVEPLGEGEESDTEVNEYLSGGDDDREEIKKRDPNEINDNSIFQMDDLRSPPMSPGPKSKVRRTSSAKTLPPTNAAAAAADSTVPIPVAVVAPNQATTVLLPVEAPSEAAINKCPEVPELAPLKDLKIELSRCGNHIFDPNYDGDEVRTSQLFRENLITFETLLANPELMLASDHDIVFRIENKLYPWAVAAPLMVSMLAFQRKLDQNTMDTMYLKFKTAIQSNAKSWVSRIFSGLRRKDEKSGTLPANFSIAEKEKRAGSLPGATTGSMVPSPSAPSLLSETPTKANGSEIPIPMNMDDDDDEDSGSGVDKNGNHVFYTKSLTPTPEVMARLGLKPGANKISFIVNSKLQGKQEVTSSIYLWDRNVKIVVSDIDGTITKTDVFGQIFPVFGKDWSHIGVTELFSNIKNNGYQMLYLTARAIGASKITKQYLGALQQESGHKLPDGPLFLAPDRLLHSLNREVILRKPEQFKITCLTQIKQLFSQNPFYAGFGNRHTDAVSYVAVGMSKSRVFIINPQSEIECASTSVRKTYKSINELVEQMFPPFAHAEGAKTKPKAEEEFNDFNYWKHSSQYSLEDLEAEILKPTSKSLVSSSSASKIPTADGKAKK